MKNTTTGKNETFPHAEIEKEMGIERDDIVQKWTILRGQFHREVDKERKSTSGQSSDDKYVSGWKFYKSLKFISSSVVVAKGKDNLEPTQPPQSSRVTPKKKKQEMEAKKVAIIKQMII